MNKIILTYSYPIPSNELGYMKKKFPSVEFIDISEHFLSETQLFSSGFQQGSNEVISVSSNLNACLRNANIYYGDELPKNLLLRAPELRWIQYASDGLNVDVTQDILNSNILFTNARGIAALCIAEWVIMVILMFSKRANDFIAERSNRQWREKFGSFANLWELKGKTVGIIGLGSIGREVARLCKAFEMRVLATRRSTTVRKTNVENVDILFPKSDIDLLLKQSDLVVLSVPGTTDTSCLIGERELHLLGPQGYLINIGRGSVIDEPVLVQGLLEGWIKGVALDVFQVEPLPDTSPLWWLPNVIMAPHISGDAIGYESNMARLLSDNLDKFIRGDKLVNEVDKTLSY